MFEVGKKYKSKVGNYIYECIFAGKTNCMFQYGALEFSVPHKDFLLYTEYKEPKSVERFLALWEDGTVSACTSENQAKRVEEGNSKVKVIGRKKVTITEGDTW